MIAFVGSLSQFAVYFPPPRLRFTDAMLYCPLSAYTRSSPAMMSDVQAMMHWGEVPQSEPENSEKIWIAMIWAPRATPENVAALPAAMPATWVPCQHVRLL